MSLRRRLQGNLTPQIPFPGFKQTFDHAFPLFGDHLSLSMGNFTDFLTDTLDCRLLISDSGREAQCAGRAPRVAYGGPDGAVPPVWRPGSYLGRYMGLSPALICISGPSVCGVSAPRPRRSEVTSW